MNFLKRYALELSLLIFTFGIFGYTLKNDFVYDDRVFVSQNELIKNPGNIFEFFINPKAYSGERDFFIYRPLAALSYAADYALWGLRPFGYHLSNIFWHAVNVILVFLLFRKFLGSGVYAWLGAAFFAIHPVQVETVGWIAQRSNVLCLFFVLCTILLRYNQKLVFQRLTLLTFIMALFAKETAIVLLFLLPLSDCYFQHFQGEKISVNVRLKEYLAYLIIIALYLLLRLSVLGQLPQRQWWGGSFFTTFLTMGKAFYYYVQVVFLPVNLSLDHVFPVVHTLKEPLVWVGFGVLTLFVLAIIYFRSEQKALTYGLAWFLIGLIPVSNVVPIQALMAERFLYVPLVGFCLTVAALAAKQKKGLYILGAGLILLSAKTVQRTTDWKNEFTLWQATVKTSPDSPRAHYALGNIYYSRGDYQQAVGEYKQAIALNPFVADLYNQLGLSYEALRDYESAYNAYHRGLQTAEINQEVKVNILTNIGNVYFRTTRYEQAGKYYQQALTLNPEAVGVRYNLAKTYYFRGQYQKAKKEIDAVYAVAPDFMQVRQWQEKIAKARMEGEIYRTREIH